MQDSPPKQSFIYPIRATEKPIIKRNRLHFFKTVVGDEEGEEDFELTSKEFVMISSLLQVNLNYLTMFLDLVTSYGGIFVSLFYLLLQLSIGMPLFMLCTFMSSYAKKSYIKFWDCVPIFQGLGYTIAIIRFTSEMYNIMAASLSLVLIFDMFRDRHYSRLSSCHGEPEGDHCLKMNPRANLTQECPTVFRMRGKNETLFIATQFYVRREVMLYNEFSPECCTFNIHMIVASLSVWLLIFCLAIFGMIRIRKIAINLQLGFGAMLFVIAIFSTSLSEHPGGAVDSKQQTSLNTFEFWVDMILHSAEINVMGNAMYLGKLKLESLCTKRASLVISLIKSTIFLLMVCYTSRIRHQLIMHYRMSDPRCLISYSHDIIFAFVPDLLYRIDFGFVMCMLWYMGIFCFAILPPVYSLVGLVDSLSEQFNKLYKYRLFVYMVCCFVGIIVYFPLCSNLSLALIYTYRIYGVPLLNTTMFLLINLALIFVYSIRRIVDDYSFTLGGPPHKYWIVFWRTTPIFALFAFIFMFYQIRSNAKQAFTTSKLMVFSYIQSTAVLLPIVIVFLTKCCKHVKYRTLGSLSKPSEQWGPYKAFKKQSRKYFYPERDVKYRNDVLNCKHNCMVNSQKFFDEKSLQDQKLQTLIMKVKSKGVDITSDLKDL